MVEILRDPLRIVVTVVLQGAGGRNVVIELFVIQRGIASVVADFWTACGGVCSSAPSV